MKACIGAAITLEVRVVSCSGRRRGVGIEKKWGIGSHLVARKTSPLAVVSCTTSCRKWCLGKKIVEEVCLAAEMFSFLKMYRRERSVR